MPSIDVGAASARSAGRGKPVSARIVPAMVVR